MSHWDKNKVLNCIAFKRGENSICTNIIATKLGLKQKEWKISARHPFAYNAAE